MGALAGNVRDVQLSQAFVRTAAKWLLGLMLAVAACIVAINLVSNTVASPQQPVRDYLDALKRGDGGAALGLLKASVPGGNAAMLDGTALQTAASKVSDVRIGAPESRGGKRVMVPLDYTIDGNELHSEFLLERTGTEWLFFGHWEFVPSSLPTIDVTVVNASEANLNGIPVNLPDGRGSFSVFYPGQYEASLSEQFFTAIPVHTAVTSNDSGQTPLNLLTRTTDSMNRAVAAKIKQYLDNCAEEATKQQRLQPDCPFYHVTNSPIEPGTIKWRITQYPKISIEPFAGGWAVAPLNGKARVTAKQIDLFTGQVSNLNEVLDFSFTTRLNIGENSIAVVPQVSY
ncbi:hypothetical protein [Arthrobacter celericrescens]|uniref:hypothetical protein n=1 Tax=Arthrobacter celericrescens TaxID=2320851 RepID=UPI000EA19E23|nr:hypothetical protein [Arthrobacter celericrescens]